MIFFSGFGLRGESVLFRGYLKESAYTVAGFSKGAIEAFEYALSASRRIDTLQLLSPAFFQQKERRFVRMQLLHFSKSQERYRTRFYRNCAAPAAIDLSSFAAPMSYEGLFDLLHYRWEERKIEMLLKRGVHIEVYLGEQDRIIDADEARRWFAKFATVYYIKASGHLLQGE